MSCSGIDTCKSGCYKDEHEGNDCASAKNSFCESPLPGSGGAEYRNICIKCKASDALGVSTAGQDGRFCYDCFRSNLFGKFKFAVSSNAMISPSDKVLLAFSGGPSSRVALQFLHEMQYAAQKNFEASRDRALHVFSFGVAFVSHSNINPETKMAIENIKDIVSSFVPPAKELHIVPIESVYSDCEDGADRVKSLLNAVNDVTGKEDLLLYLQMLSLQKVACKNGYTKLLFGSCTSKIACHVISAIVKGQGYSLPASIQYVDARWAIPVILPLRDCLARELNLLCALDGLKTLEMFKGPYSGINGLVSSFVKLLQEENPSREPTILRTAGKLMPFDFNKIPPPINHKNGFSASSLEKRLKNIDINSNLFCSICNSPVDGESSLKDSMDLNVSGATFCASCRFQILPHGDPSCLEHFFSLLPRSMTAQMEGDGCGNRQARLRGQIKDFLLPDGEDGN